MKKVLFFIAIILVILGFFYFIYKKEAIAPVITAPLAENKVPATVPDATQTEYCYANFGTPDKNGNYDIDTLRLFLEGNNAKGELNILPGGKDSTTGEFEGTVSAADKTTGERTADLWWYSVYVGDTVKGQLKIIFDNKKASIASGEMVDRGDGVYVYKDPTKLSYNVNISKIDCLKLTERANVENYLQNNIENLSPVKPTLGGSWYILWMTVDMTKNTGTVVYEDGHTQENKTFSYKVDEKGAVTSMIIK